METWKDIEWFEWLYQISNTWLFKSIKWWRWGNWNHKILIPWTANWGYLVARMQKDNKQHSIYIHRLVALHFINNHENKEEVNHKDWNKENNHIDNLEWVTRSENMQHRRKDLWKRWWELHNSVKVKQFTLNWEYIKTWDSIIDITRELWIDNSTISKVCRWKLKKTWWFIFKYN